MNLTCSTPIAETNDTDKFKSPRNLAIQLRNVSLKMALGVGKTGSHLGAGLSSVEIFAVLYGKVLNTSPGKSSDPTRDRLVLSRGHSVLSYYAALCEMGFLSREELSQFEVNGAFLHGHATRELSKGIEFSGGSLGMGITYAVGVALAAKLKSQPQNVYVIIGDGECDEGIVWEACMCAAHYKLDNLTVIVDHNKLQYDGKPSEIMNLGDLKAKLTAFGLHAVEVDGHSVEELSCAFDLAVSGQPKAIIAHTVKGKGVSFMEGRKEWHHSPLSQEQFNQAMAEQPAIAD
jgi:transketolase